MAAALGPPTAYQMRHARRATEINEQDIEAGRELPIPAPGQSRSAGVWDDPGSFTLR
jgi:cytochrome P450